MNSAQQLTESIRRILVTIDKTRHGAIGAFCKRDKIENSQFKKLLREGVSARHVITRVLAAIDYKVPTALSIVCEEYNTTQEDLQSNRSSTEPRQVAAYLMAKQKQLTLADISRELGYGGHPSVSKALKAVGDRIDTEAAFRRKVFTMQAKLGL